MRKASILGVVCVLLVGCGTLLDIKPDSPPTAVDDGGMEAGSSRDGDVLGADAGDGASPDGTVDPGPGSCIQSAATDPCVVASGLVDLGSIAVANGSVFFTLHATSGAVLQVSKNGGAVSSFAGSNLPAGLYATSTALYWVTEGDDQIVRHTFGSGTRQASTNGAATPAAHIVGLGTDTFWTIPGVGADAGQVRAASAAFNAGAGIVVNETMPTALAIDSTYVYFATKTTAGHVTRFLFNGTAMAIDDIAFRDISGIALSGAGTGIVAITSLDGVHRASTQTDATFKSPWSQVSMNATGVGLVADATSGTLYVLAADGALEVIPNVPSPPITTLKIASCPSGTALAQDDTFVFLACKDTIVRVHK